MCKCNKENSKMHLESEMWLSKWACKILKIETLKNRSKNDVMAKSRCCISNENNKTVE